MLCVSQNSAASSSDLNSSGRGSTFLCVFGIVLPLRRRHVACRDRQRHAALLVNEKDDQIPPVTNLSQSSVHVLPAHVPLGHSPDNRPAKEHLLRLRNRHTVFVGQLRDGAFLPDNVRNSQRMISNIFLSGYAHRTLPASSPSRTPTNEPRASWRQRRSEERRVGKEG